MKCLTREHFLDIKITSAALTSPLLQYSPLQVPSTKMYFSLPNTGAQFLIVLLSAQNFASAACVNPPIRSEWCVTPASTLWNLLPSLTSFLSVRRTLSKTNQLSYIGAVKCMQSLPGTTANLYPGVRSRYDDYQGLHINQTDFIHFVVRQLFLLLGISKV